jgi:hypothetical protein
MRGIAFVAQVVVASVAVTTLLPAELAAQRIPPAPRTPTAPLPPGATVPGVAARPALPAPAGVTVTGTPASAIVVWQSVQGAASYVVTRRQTNVPDKQAKLAATDTRWADIGLRPST